MTPAILLMILCALIAQIFFLVKIWEANQKTAESIETLQDTIHPKEKRFHR